MSDRANELRNMVGLLTEADLIAMFNVSEHTLQAWRVAGTGPKYCKLGKTVFYRKADVADWINDNIHTRTTSPALETSAA